MIKKTIFTLLALCLCTTSLWAVGYNQTEWADSDRDAATVYTDSQTGLSFYVLDGSAVLTYAEASSSNYSSLTSLTLPETVSDGTTTYTVTKVGDYAFDHASNIAGELVVPANILTLGRSAFEGCTGITSVTIDYAETNLANGNNQNWGTPFYSCSGITTVTLNRNLTQGRSVTSGYRTELFSDLTNIETVYIGENVTEILHDLFNCNNSSSCKLATVYCYAATVPTLGSGAFDSHTDLTLHVYESLGDAYSSSDWATYFSTITNDIPDPEIEDGSLKDVETGLYFDVDAEGVVSIIADKLGTYDNSNLVANADGSYTLPEKVSADGVTYYDVTRIDASAFANSSISGHFVIPAHITTMGISAFQNCTSLTEVTYEYSETAVKEENEGSSSGAVNITFEGCSNIKTVNLNRNITLGSSSRHVGPFEYINGVTKVTIGENVTEIPNFLVRNTSTQCLSEVYCYPTTVPTTNYDPFGNFTSCTLYVPKGYKDTYSSASYATRSYTGDNATTWGEFFTSIEEMEGESTTEPAVFSCDIDPESGTSHESLDAITFSNEYGIYWNEDEENGYEGDPVTYVDPEGNEVEMDNMGTTWDPDDSDKEIAQIIMFSENPMVEAGDYTVTVPASFFYAYDENGNKAYNDAIVLTYTITPAEEGPLCDLATGLYFDIDDDGVVSIIAPEEGAYSNDNLVKTDDGAYTLPAQVSATEVIAYAAEGTYDVTRIDASAFEGASISGHLVIPATITALGSKAFYNCTELTEVTLEYSETALKEENNQLYTTSFYSCSNLQTVHMNREVSLARGDNDNNHVYRISPFSDLTSIETIYIGENVTSIPYNMFNCNNTSSCALSEVYCYATNVPTLAYQAFGTHSDLTLYVYKAVEENYENDTQTYSWPSFFSTITSIEGTETEGGGSFSCDIDPESGTSHESLDAITFSNEYGIYWNEDEENGYEGDPVTYVDPEGNEVEMDNMGTTWDPDDSDKEIAQIIMFSENPMAESGEYTVTVPASFFYAYDENGNKAYNDAIVLTYTITPAEEGPLCDLATGLYFDIDDDGVVSIIAPEEGVYSNDNLVKTDDGAYTLPAQVSATEVIAYAAEGTYDVTRIDASAFEGASISGHLIIPANITAVGEMAFKSCTGLTEVTYEYSETALKDESAGNNTGTQSFNGCSGVTTVHMNRDITIGHSGYLCAPFCYNTSVTTVYIGEYVTNIPDYMFRNTSTKCLATVYCYATTPPTLGTAPFDEMASEHNLYVNYDDVNTYKADSSWEAIFGKANIHSLTGEDPDEPEDEYAFEYEGLWYEPIFDESGDVTENCEIIAPVEGEYSGEVSIPATATNETTGETYNVTRIDASAFANSSVSGHLVIPANITAVGEKAFQNCTGLTEVTYEYSETALKDESAGNNTGSECFLGCSGVTTVNLNRDITLGHSGYLCAPFCYNNSVTTVYIGENVTLVPDFMFRNTSTKCLTTVYCYATSVPSTNYDPFGTLPDSGCTLYVPAGCKDTYDTASYSAGSYSGDNAITWGEYFNIVEIGSGESGDTFECDVDPADKETISELSQVTFTNPNGGEILCNDDYPTYPEFNVYDEEGNLVTIMNNVTPIVENGLEVAQVLTFGYGDEDGNGYPSVVTEEGTYYVTVPAEIFIIYDESGNALYNEGMTLTYIVSADATEEPNYTLDISPESGTVLESLSTISITCEDGIMWNTLGWADVVIYDGNGDELDNEVTWEEVASSTGAITEVDLTISPTITANGDYTVVIPEGYFLISGTIESKAITLEYTISTSTGIRGISINDENVEGIYSTSGQKLNSTAKGVNIILFNDGSVKKIYVK